jgi:hypothetical protein
VSQFGSGKERAHVHYQSFVRAGIGLSPVQDKINNNIYIYNQQVVGKTQSLFKAEPNDYTMQQIADAFAGHFRCQQSAP